MSQKIKDNPVPSLDKALLKTLNVVGNPINFDDYKYGFSEGAKYLAKELQNGVETYKEDPSNLTVSGKKKCYIMD